VSDGTTQIRARDGALGSDHTLVHDGALAADGLRRGAGPHRLGIAACIIVLLLALAALAVGRAERAELLETSRALATDPAVDQHPAVDAAALTYTYAVGTFAPEFTPPAPGTYTLPVVDDLGDHPLVESDGRRTSLFAAKRGRAAVVAFIYTTCAEAAGCPLSMAVQSRLDAAIAADPELASSVALLTISFDPERDTPERLARVRAAHRPASDWHFLTTANARELDGVLTDFGQPVAKLRYPDGMWTGFYRHVLKVFLVDREDRVRNIYSAGFLSPEVILNDLRTILAPTS
jgi:cytochrome oxidase Cu insertion factor (SCO1/SenC/PrrC family)